MARTFTQEGLERRIAFLKKAIRNLEKRIEEVESANLEESPRKKA
jgi:hypothetical protein